MLLYRSKFVYQVYGANVIIGVYAPHEDKELIKNLLYNCGCTPHTVEFREIYEGDKIVFFKFQTNAKRLFEGIKTYFEIQLFDQNPTEKQIYKLARDFILSVERDNSLLDERPKSSYFLPREKNSNLAHYAGC